MHAMLLRGSGEFELQAVMDTTIDSGVEHGRLLGQLVDAIISRDWDLVATLREECVAVMGNQETVDSIAVASAFNGITRIADATGIPLDSGPAESTASMRSQLAINNFSYSEKSRKYDQVSV